MSIKVSFDISRLENAVTSAGVEQAKLTVANQVLLDSEKYVPKRHGALVETGRTEGNSAVVWHTVYARAHYFGTNGIVEFRKYSTPGTGTKWVEKAAESNMKNWEQIVLKGLKLQ